MNPPQQRHLSPSTRLFKRVSCRCSGEATAQPITIHSCSGRMRADCGIRVEAKRKKITSLLCSSFNPKQLHHNDNEVTLQTAHRTRTSPIHPSSTSCRPSLSCERPLRACAPQHARSPSAHETFNHPSTSTKYQTLVVYRLPQEAHRYSPSLPIIHTYRLSLRSSRPKATTLSASDSLHPPPPLRESRVDHSTTRELLCHSRQS